MLLVISGPGQARLPIQYVHLPPCRLSLTQTLNVIAVSRAPFSLFHNLG